jgi:hypothetical protein
MDVDNDRPPDLSLQPSMHPRFQLGIKSINRKNEAVRMSSRDDDDSDSALAHSSEMDHRSPINQKWDIFGKLPAPDR